MSKEQRTSPQAVCLREVIVEQQDDIDMLSGEDTGTIINFVIEEWNVPLGKTSQTIYTKDFQGQPRDTARIARLTALAHAVEVGATQAAQMNGQQLDKELKKYEQLIEEHGGFFPAKEKTPLIRWFDQQSLKAEFDRKVSQS